MLLGVVDGNRAGSCYPRPGLVFLFTPPPEGVGPDPFRSHDLNWSVGRWTVPFSGPWPAFVCLGPFVSDGFLFCVCPVLSFSVLSV